MTSHHPNDDLLLSYAGGSLGESWGLVVATHLGLCQICLEMVGIAEDVGGVLLDDISPENLSNNLLDRITARFDDPISIEERVPVPSDPILPQPLREYIGGGLETIPWRGIGMGIYQHRIFTNDSGQARLLKIPAGRPVPEHGHNGRELTLVLAGSFNDKVGEFVRGDVEDVDQEIVHRPVATSVEECICLAVTESPLKFKSLLPKLAQHFIRI